MTKRNPLMGQSSHSLSELWQELEATNPSPEERQRAYDTEFGPAIAAAVERDEARRHLAEAIIGGVARVVNPILIRINALLMWLDRRRR